MMGIAQALASQISDRRPARLIENGIRQGQKAADHRVPVLDRRMAGDQQRTGILAAQTIFYRLGVLRPWDRLPAKATWRSHRRYV